MPRTCLNDDLNRPGLPAHYSPHSFRATRITNFLENDGTLEAAQRIAGHARQLYDRRGKRFCSKTSSASGINVNLKNNARLHVRVQHVAPPVPGEAKLGYTLRVIDWLLMVAYEWQSPDWSVAAKVYEPGSNGGIVRRRPVLGFRSKLSKPLRATKIFA